VSEGAAGEAQESRAGEATPALAAALKKNARARRTWDAVTPSHRSNAQRIGIERNQDPTIGRSCR
jgi:hypothetical protein